MNCRMIEEALESPEIIRKKLVEDKPYLLVAAALMEKVNPSLIVTFARGSSDHAASYLNYLITCKMGIPTSSLPPSLTTLHESKLQLRNSLAIAISQSGASPDICSSLQAARRMGAKAMALVNQTGSPLGAIADISIPIGAGVEHSIAATKSYIASLVTGIALLAEWQNNLKLKRDLLHLPDLLQNACQLDWSESVENLQDANHLIVLSRGLGLPIANEVGLKSNEICRLPSLVYSTAEFKHGPIALLRSNDPILVIGIRGPELPHIQDVVRELRLMGAKVIFIAPKGTGQATFCYPKSNQPLFDPIIAIQALYPFIARLACARGFDPDLPSHLQKVTMTY